MDQVSKERLFDANELINLFKDEIEYSATHYDKVENYFLNLDCRGMFREMYKIKDRECHELNKHVNDWLVNQLREIKIHFSKKKKEKIYKNIKSLFIEIYIGFLAFTYPLRERVNDHDRYETGKINKFSIYLIENEEDLKLGNIVFIEYH